jgi:hypothetical protein
MPKGKRPESLNINENALQEFTKYKINMALKIAMDEIDVDPKDCSYIDMRKYLTENKALWEYEDLHVPSEVKLNIEIGKEDGNAPKHIPYTLTNKLSDDLLNMMYRTRVGR